MNATQANVEYWFRLLYECIHGSCYGSMAGISSLATYLWVWIVGIGYILAVAGLVVIIYTTVMLFELRKREHEFYTTLIDVPETTGGSNARWQHIEELAGSESASEWREAIIEADIMLDELLTKRGYTGAGVSEKLKNVDKADFASLQDAWEAHKVRNQVAHEGSAFELSATFAKRVIGRYEAVFREFKVI